MKWQEIFLEECTQFIKGGTWNQNEYSANGIPVVKVTNLAEGTVKMDNLSFIPESSLLKYNRHQLKENDLVIATVGSHPNVIASAAGRAFKIPRKAEGYLLNQNIVCIRSTSSLLSQMYLTYLGQGVEFQAYVRSIPRGAANQVRIQIGLTKLFKFKLPPLPIQRRIASILSDYGDLIENNLRRIKLLEAAAKCEYRVLIAESNEELPLNEVAMPIKRGISPRYVVTDGIVVINQKCIRALNIDFSLARLTDRNKSVKSERMLNKYDVLVNSTGMGTLGRVSINLNTDFACTVDLHVTIVRAIDESMSSFMAM